MDFYKTEYSKKFDELRENRVRVSFFKYGSAKDNFKPRKELGGKSLVSALGSLEKTIIKYKETLNTEYLLDAANYLMFEFMYPSFEGAYFKATDSNESAGIDGISIKEIN